MPPLRPMPVVGARVTVASLGKRVAGVIEEISADGRRLVVVTDGGEALVFGLSRATGRFMEEGRQTGARLLFEDLGEPAG
jgi:hypothetical protein